ncbi:hypothetical protein AALI21_02905 [Corynebacteriaceae bacterium 6-324]
MTNHKPTNQPRQLDRGQQVTNFIRYSITEGLKEISEQMHSEPEEAKAQ